MQYLIDAQDELTSAKSTVNHGNPACGARVLFFSGGSALHSLCQPLIDYTHNSIHLVPPFDSGGSSAELRKMFKMPAIGDVRARLLSLIDRTQQNADVIASLFNYRFKHNDTSVADAIQKLISGKHHLLHDIAPGLTALVQRNLLAFLSAVPNEFNYRNAAIGNLVLVGGYLFHDRQLEPALFELSELMGVKGKVRLTVNDDYHLSVKLNNGRRLIGQHLMTGKEYPAISSPIKEIALSKSTKRFANARSNVSDITRSLIEQADLVCFPPGSFYSSVVANLLPDGIVHAVAKNPNPKVYVPSLGRDPEMLGLNSFQSIEKLASLLTDKQANKTSLTHVLLDKNILTEQLKTSSSQLKLQQIEKLGIQIIQTDLMSAKYFPYYDPHKLCRALMQLAK